MSRHSGNHTFSSIPKAEIQRSTFDRSHTIKTTFDEGYLVPIFCDEALPGDTFNLKLHAFARMATPIKPVMDNIYLDTFFFAVPVRLIWENWVKFCGEQKTPGDSTDYTIPYMDFNGGGGIRGVASLDDYLGIPQVTLTYDEKISSLWHRAYNLIYNEWFRDENLCVPAHLDVDDGPDDPDDYIMRKRGKRHDYFTSCLPWPQKGPDVTLPLFGAGAELNVLGMGWEFGHYSSAGIKTIQDTKDPSTGGEHTFIGDVQNLDVATTFYVRTQTTSGDHVPHITVSLDNAVAASINSLRQAFQLQKLYERDARGGTRYTEIIRSHFGVVSPDARLQRPEYLGGGSERINVHPIAQTAATGATGTPQGNLAAFATGSINGHGFNKSFTEHCILLGIANVRADLNYQQGLNRMFSRRTRFDFYWPALAHIGEQAVLNKEIYLTNVVTGAGNTGNDDVWGYQERYAEYRYKPSMITGLFRSQVASSLEVWHLADHYTAMPQLNSVFIQLAPEVSRCVAVPSEPHFLFDGYFDLRCTRPMPVYSVPGLIDHF